MCRIFALSRVYCVFFFFSSRRRHTRFDCDWSSDVCSSDLFQMKATDWGTVIGRAGLRLGYKSVGVMGLQNAFVLRSEEHTSELQSQSNLVCRLLLEKKKKSQMSAA